VVKLVKKLDYAAAHIQMEKALKDIREYAAGQLSKPMPDSRVGALETVKRLAENGLSGISR